MDYLKGEIMSQNVYDFEEAKWINKKFEIPEETEIIKYMSFTKFINLLEFEALFSNNVENFEDKFEGQMPEGFYKNWPHKSVEVSKQHIKAMNKIRKCYANCWNNFGEIESYALWRIYGESKESVAIKTSIRNLKEALENKDVMVYKIEYIKSYEDKKTDIEPPFYFTQDRFTRVTEVFKHSSYNYEREIRALFYATENVSGKSLKVNLSKLIDEIYINPYAEDWFVNLVNRVVKGKDEIKYKNILKSAIKFN